MMDAPGLNLLQTIRQEQILSPMMLQKMALFTLPIAELRERIQKELEENPALEIPDAPSIHEPFPSSDPERGAGAGFALTAPGQGQDGDGDGSSEDGSARGAGEGLDEEFGDSFDLPNLTSGDYDEGASDRKSAFIENSSVVEETLADYLAEQLGASTVSPELEETAMIIITSLDSNGFFTRPLEGIIEDPEHRALLPEAVRLIQSFEPPGVCVPGYRESLILQAGRKGMLPQDLEIFADLVRNHFEDLRPGRLPNLAVQLGISEDDLNSYCSFLRTLTPYPGGQFAGGANAYVIPELSIRRKGDDLALSINRSSLPNLSLSPDFASLADNLEGDEAKRTASFIGESLRRARLLISQVELRYKTLCKTALALMEMQRDFFLDGPEHLKPLTLRDVAEKVGVHETTISRISQSKWVDTDWGLFQIKDLFTQGLRTDSAEEISRTVVKQKIERIIEDNDGALRLSDQKIADILAKQGIKIARRTVAKYRAELNIDSSYDR